jgi:hypothetical protein
MKKRTPPFKHWWNWGQIYSHLERAAIGCWYIISDVASLGTWSTIAAPVTESSVVARIGRSWSIKSNSYYIVGKQENAKNISISFIIRVGDWKLSCGTGISVA